MGNGDGRYDFDFKVVPMHAKDEKLDREIFGKAGAQDVRTFDCHLVRPVNVKEAAKAEYLLFSPQKLLLIQFVKFVPGKGYKEFLEYYRGEFEARCKAMWGTDRHGLGVHEVLTFFTLGEYDLVILLEAKDMEAYGKFMAVQNQPGSSGSTYTQTVPLLGAHPNGR